mmetsp:Transcript_17855/g.31034  ORF Transcript_17855/g.31034 Transcript_17855/m.31034 type:complete len:341 (+) Transcript_17855:284-1306(+)
MLVGFHVNYLLAAPIKSNELGVSTICLRNTTIRRRAIRLGNIISPSTQTNTNTNTKTNINKHRLISTTAVSPNPNPKPKPKPSLIFPNNKAILYPSFLPQSLAQYLIDLAESKSWNTDEEVLDGGRLYQQDIIYVDSERQWTQPEYLVLLNKHNVFQVLQDSLQEYFGLERSRDYIVSYVFIRKYQHGLRPNLLLHSDQSIVSLTIELSERFDGFWILDEQLSQELARLEPDYGFRDDRRALRYLYRAITNLAKKDYILDVEAWEKVRSTKQAFVNKLVAWEEFESHLESFLLRENTLQVLGMSQGDAVIFPGYLYHRVSSVKPNQTRYSLVVFIEKPLS